MARWLHDCTACRFLGTLTKEDEGTAVDFYEHKTPSGATLVARIGDDGPDYSSAPIELARKSRGLLRIAVALAEGDL